MSQSKEELNAQPRVVSLLSGLTEAVYGMGLGHLLVARSHECDWPPEALVLPMISQARVDVQAASLTIDEQVRETMQSSGTSYKLHFEEMQKLQPTVILVQNSCRVCAVTPDALQGVAENSIGEPGSLGNCNIVTVFPKCLEDVFNDCKSVAAALGYPGKGNEFVTQLKARLTLVEQHAIGHADVKMRQLGPHPKPKVLVAEWCDPFMGCGYWIPELVSLAGGRCLFGGVGEHTEYISIHDVAKHDPDYIVFACCGFSVKRSTEELCQTTLLTAPLWKSLTAVRTGNVFIADGNRYFNRSGPSVVDTAEIIAQVLGSFPARFSSEDVMSLQDALNEFQFIPRVEAQTEAEVSLLSLEDARQVVQETVGALQEGSSAGIKRAYEHSAVSACMSPELYTSTIIQHPDFQALANATLTATYGEPYRTGSTQAKVEVIMMGHAGATYTFRMQTMESTEIPKWMIEGVSKIA